MRTASQSMGLSGDIGQIEIDPRVGDAFLFTDIRDGTEARHWGTYLELERPHKVVFTWIVDGAVYSVSESQLPSRRVSVWDAPGTSTSWTAPLRFDDTCIR